MALWSRLVNALREDRLNREIDEEMESHLAEAVELGRDPEEARRAFGSRLRLREDSWDAQVSSWLVSLRADLVFGWRQLRKHKAASLAAVLSLALAMGSCLAAFRLIDALLLRPLPVSHPERLRVLTYPYLNAAGNDSTLGLLRVNRTMLWTVSGFGLWLYEFANAVKSMTPFCSAALQSA